MGVFLVSPDGWENDLAKGAVVGIPPVLLAEMVG